MQEEEKEREIRWKQFLYTYNDSLDDEFDEEDWNWGGLCAVEHALKKGEDLDVQNGDVFLDELTKNVRSGVPAALRGEVCHIFVLLLEFWSPNFCFFGVQLLNRTGKCMQLWQVFSGAKEQWVEGRYQELLAGRETKVVKPTLEKWASQIEKVSVFFDVKPRGT